MHAFLTRRAPVCTCRAPALAEATRGASHPRSRARRCSCADGAPKRWYVVPPSHAQAVRTLAAASFPDLAHECSSFMRHKTIMLSPQVLKGSNIPVRLDTSE
jgi:hypothetical protein